MKEPPPEMPPSGPTSVRSLPGGDGWPGGAAGLGASGPCSSCLSWVIGQGLDLVRDQQSHRRLRCEGPPRPGHGVGVCSQRGRATVVTLCRPVERSVRKHTPRSTPGACRPRRAVAELGGPLPPPRKPRSVPASQPPWLRHTEKSM